MESFNYNKNDTITNEYAGTNADLLRRLTTTVGTMWGARQVQTKYYADSSGNTRPLIPSKVRCYTLRSDQDIRVVPWEPLNLNA